MKPNKIRITTNKNPWITLIPTIQLFQEQTFQPRERIVIITFAFLFWEAHINITTEIKPYTTAPKQDILLYAKGAGMGEYIGYLDHGLRIYKNDADWLLISRDTNGIQNVIGKNPTRPATKEEIKTYQSLVK